jgi:hypothetical protein
MENAALTVSLRACLAGWYHARNATMAVVGCAEVPPGATPVGRSKTVVRLENKTRL